MPTMLQKPINLSKFDLYSRGMQALHSVLGTVDTEEFISFVKSDQFDYTKWQRQHFDAKTPEQISNEAEAYVTEHPYSGDPASVI